MTSLDSSNPFACEAFLRTLPRLPQPLSDDQRQSIRAVLWDIQQHKSGVSQDIEALVDRDALLKAQYEAAYTELLQHYQANERAKTAAIAGTLELPQSELERWADAILRTGDDVVAAARSVVKPLQGVSSQNQSSVWERGDRLIALTAGGAALGATIAQVPGAFIGGILAAVFSWFTSGSKSEQARTAR